LFLVRHRKSTQWYLTRDYDGLLYVFKSKIFPLGQEPLAQEIWQKMRIPVAVWSDWPGHFYPTIHDYMQNSAKSRQ
jgi:hypothetical protein